MKDWSPRSPADSSVANWLASRTNRRPYAGNPWVQDAVGPGWPAYARIFCAPHRASSWAEVARRNDATMHALAEWRKINKPSVRPGWNHNVDEGFLPASGWTTLCRILGAETTTPDSIFCLLWEVRGSENHPQLARLPHVQYQGTTCWLAEDSLREIAKLEGWDQPDYLWPSDHTWTVMSHYDSEFAVVGATRSCIDALLASSKIEALEVPADSQWGDTIN